MTDCGSSLLAVTTQWHFLDAYQRKITLRNQNDCNVAGTKTALTVYCIHSFCEPMVNPTMHTNERQDAWREEGLSNLWHGLNSWNVDRRKHEYSHQWQYTWKHIFIPYTLTTNTYMWMFFRLKSSTHLDNFPSYWIFMSTCFLPNIHKITTTTWMYCTICPSELIIGIMLYISWCCSRILSWVQLSAHTFSLKLNYRNNI